jgi:hypothetical protein
MFAGSEWSQSVNTTGLDSGLYRVSKEIGYDGQRQVFYAEFTLVRSLALANGQATSFEPETSPLDPTEIVAIPSKVNICSTLQLLY